MSLHWCSVGREGKCQPTRAVLQALPLLGAVHGRTLGTTTRSPGALPTPFTSVALSTWGRGCACGQGCCVWVEGGGASPLAAPCMCTQQACPRQLASPPFPTGGRRLPPAAARSPRASWAACWRRLLAVWRCLRWEQAANPPIQPALPGLIPRPPAPKPLDVRLLAVWPVACLAAPALPARLQALPTAAAAVEHRAPSPPAALGRRLARCRASMLARGAPAWACRPTLRLQCLPDRGSSVAGTLLLPTHPRINAMCWELMC
jgi:hypothetical protein